MDVLCLPSDKVLIVRGGLVGGLYIILFVDKVRVRSCIRRVGWTLVRVLLVGLSALADW